MQLIYKFSEIDKSMVGTVGGKGANLGELSKIAGINVPDGFVISTDSFKEQVGDEIKKHVSDDEAYAVRSSATAEDSLTTSFAGQFDTYLNVIGVDNILKSIEKCQASVNNESAKSYFTQHDEIKMAVVVQKMVNADASGVLFTADPISSNRKVSSIDAARGLGDALVSGRVNGDVYKVREGSITSKRINTSQILTDKQIIALEKIGRTIEKHFGAPQDIEWCLANDTFYIVQSRPITTLFPIPQANDNDYHIYISVGHQQMMTDALKPLGLSLRQLAALKMYTAAGRQFVDVAKMLANPATKETLLDNMGQHDPLIKDAIETLLGERGVDRKMASKPNVKADPKIALAMIKKFDDSTELLRQTIEGKTGSELIDIILKDIGEIKRLLLDPDNNMMIYAVVDSSRWLNEKMMEWLGEKNVADVLTQSVPNNVTSEMGLALLDVADAFRSGEGDGNRALGKFLEKYGMRCPGEIDITRPRWIEKPEMLMPAIQNNIRNFAPGESKRKFENGLKEAADKEAELLSRLDESRAADTKEVIDILRTYAGYREYPKYFIVTRFWIYKQALLKEYDEEIFWLTFEELREKKFDRDVVDQRKRDYEFFQKLTPPRVITSDGEIVNGSYNRDDLPANALVGLAVSSGVVEGRARVILNMEDADLSEGDILVTKFTDPSWTPLFVSIKGLVTEVGGLMTHGAVIAREYGLPAVVGVENATSVIKNGQRIRVNGTDGYIEII